ncbi:GNAT family N-acetyltransferase [Poseidonocella sedimentorum]|uniref:Acetyltransferase (GNAT) family protein n=1 Tax=Poseidonocella sedimentorum TaxID=871652 RepID=A0A1I6DEG0_9RHOB|nr:GNAT family N-acetyltransferase [Poseidonocella sedimentorum]SFR03758.1 Acetyltransferase (GNAT) family protein [Poseidonocella sedimentorum]
MVSAMHDEVGIASDPAHRQAALEPLLNGSPHGAIWLIGPRRAPVGYIVVSFGWSIEFGGLDGIIDELFIRRAVRRRGMASDALAALTQALTGSGLTALHLEVDLTDATASRLYTRAGFRPRDGYALMSRPL